MIAAEFIMAPSGLGYAIAYAYNNFDNRTMYALMLFVIVLVTPSMCCSTSVSGGLLQTAGALTCGAHCDVVLLMIAGCRLLAG